MDQVATHQRCLIGSVLKTTGPILELGTGWYSTPILHEIAVSQQRHLVTLDNNKYWLEQFKATNWQSVTPLPIGLEHEFHLFHYVEWWDDVRLKVRDYFPESEKNRWSVVFVDNGPPIERYYLMRRFFFEIEKNLQKEPTVFVFHDTEDYHPYGYSRIIPKFRYKFTDKAQLAHTTVCSNEFDVSQWFVSLPPVKEVIKEVT